MTLTERTRELVQACFSGIWIQSHEHTDAIDELAVLCREEAWPITVWDVDAGLRSATDRPLETAAADPLSAIRYPLSAVRRPPSARSPRWRPSTSAPEYLRLVWDCAQKRWSLRDRVVTNTGWKVFGGMAPMSECWSATVKNVTFIFPGEAEASNVEEQLARE